MASFPHLSQLPKRKEKGQGLQGTASSSASQQQFTSSRSSWRTSGWVSLAHLSSFDTPGVLLPSYPLPDVSPTFLFLKQVLKSCLKFPKHLCRWETEKGKLRACSTRDSPAVARKGVDSGKEQTSQRAEGWSKRRIYLSKELSVSRTPLKFGGPRKEEWRTDDKVESRSSAKSLGVHGHQRKDGTLLSFCCYRLCHCVNEN